MAAHVEVEEIRTTKSEKTLALVLAVFLFIGGIWAYARVDDSARAVVTVPAAAAGRRLGEAQERAHERQALLGFLFRLLLVVILVASGFLLLGRLRRRGSRYLPLGLAWVGFAAVLALVMAGDYLTDYVDPLDLGPLVLALVGIAFTLGAFAA